MRGHSYSFNDYMERATSPETIIPDDDSYGHYCGFTEHDNSIVSENNSDNSIDTYAIDIGFDDFDYDSSEDIMVKTGACAAHIVKYMMTIIYIATTVFAVLVII